MTSLPFDPEGSGFIRAFKGDIPTDKIETLRQSITKILAFSGRQALTPFGLASFFFVFKSSGP